MCTYDTVHCTYDTLCSFFQSSSNANSQQWQELMKLFKHIFNFQWRNCVQLQISEEYFLRRNVTLSNWLGGACDECTHLSGDNMERDLSHLFLNCCVKKVISPKIIRSGQRYFERVTNGSQKFYYWLQINALCIWWWHERVLRKKAINDEVRAKAHSTLYHIEY